MFKRITHDRGVIEERELLFSTQFNYLFPDAARSRQCLLGDSSETRQALRQLAVAMADPGGANLDADGPAVLTYLGQFIDHDLTARTDRETGTSELGHGEPGNPRDPDEVVGSLRNGRRPQLDLDSLFGDGPGLAPHAKTESQKLYEPDFSLVLFDEGGRVDVPRGGDRVARIGDMRNDENLVISQLHAAMLRFANAVHDGLAGDDRTRHIRARQLVRWAYQHVVLHDYLPHVCDPAVVADVLANGPRAFPLTGHAFMPLEFSVAAFRFGHSMIRPSYRISAAAGEVDLISMSGSEPRSLGFAGVPSMFAADHQLDAKFNIDWANFVGPTAQRHRRIDTLIAQGLGTLPLDGRSDEPILAHLAHSNLRRALSLSIPTGQAIAEAFAIEALTPKQILSGETPAMQEALKAGYFQHRSPLWYYVLREAKVQQNGQRLGELGSRIVAETIVGMVKTDPNGVVANRPDPAITDAGVEVAPGAVIGSLADLLRHAGFTGI